jgi:hypothetical protein
VNVEAGAHPGDEASEAEVLNDDGINAGFDDSADEKDGFGEFIGEDEGVEGDVAANVVAVEIRDGFGKLFEGEISSAVAGVEVAESEVDGISAVGDGGAHRIKIAGWR